MKISKSKKNILGFLTLICFSFVACQNNLFMNEYEWYPMLISAQGYPVRFDKGGFTYPGGGTSVPGRSEFEGLVQWGDQGGSYIAGPELKPVPESFSISWFSFLENKYYQGRFELPTKKIDSLFATGFKSRLNRQKNYDFINVGVAPGGVICVWLTSSRTTEIGRFQAKEAPIPPIDELLTDSFLKTTDEYIDWKLASIKEGGDTYMNPDSIPYGLWDTYRKRYSYRQRIEFLNDEELLDWQTDFYNGESFFIGSFDPIITEYTDQAVPRYTHPNWIYNDSLYGVGITFNETEVMKAFETVFSNEKTGKAELIIKVDRFNSDVQILLKSESDSIEITKARTNVWHREK